MNNFFENLPKKRMAAGALFFDENNNLLILKPTHKDYWSIPGGVVEKDESPREACIRETEEEIGINYSIGKLLCVDYSKHKTESLQFVFFGGTLSAEEIKNIKLPPDEIEDYKFVSSEEALSLVSSRLKKRLIHSLKNINSNTSVYLEEGELK